MDPFQIDHELVAYVVACVAAIRKYYPKVDGPYVPIVAVLVATVFCLWYSAQKAPFDGMLILGAVINAFKIAVAAVGGAEFLKWGAGKLGGAK